MKKEFSFNNKLHKNKWLWISIGILLLTIILFIFIPNNFLTIHGNAIAISNDKQCSYENKSFEVYSCGDFKEIENNFILIISNNRNPACNNNDKYNTGGLGLTSDVKTTK